MLFQKDAITFKKHAMLLQKDAMKMKKEVMIEAMC